jgi:hypothetical protein
MTEGEARLEIARTARALLSGMLSYIEGARKIAALHFPANLEHDPDVTRFIAIDSQTDALPAGEARKNWLPAALLRLEPEISRAEAWAQEFANAAAQSLARRFSPLV